MLMGLDEPWSWDYNTNNSSVARMWKIPTYNQISGPAKGIFTTTNVVSQYFIKFLTCDPRKSRVCNGFYSSNSMTTQLC